MQNPFLRLKKYQPGKNDTKENWATESLAACLVFSVPIRRLFLDFLFGRPSPTEDADSYEIQTQYPTDDGNWIDLLIEKEGVVSIAVEVKVDQPEDDKQIRKYAAWLERTRKKSRSYVLHLVKNHEPSFDIKKYGGFKSHDWKTWYKRLQEFRKHESGTTDANLAEHLCGYLEAEGIVNTWRPEEILPYWVGLNAKNALQGLFTQLKAKFEDNKPDAADTYSTFGTLDAGEPWFGVGLNSWAKIFGADTKLTRAIVVCDNERGSASADGMTAFRFEIVLWWKDNDRDAFQGDWTYTRSPLTRWAKQLQRAGFQFSAWRRGWRPLEIPPNFDFEYAPLYFCARKKAGNITCAAMRKMDSEELASAVYDQLIRCCQTVSGLE